MATAITLPSDQGDSGSWGPKLNTAITAVRDAADAAQTTASGAQTSATAANAKATSALLIARPPLNKVGANYWYSPQRPAAINVPMETANGYFVPYLFDKTVTIDQAQINVVTLAASSVIRSAIYADDGAGKPTGAPLGTIGTFDASATGLKLVTIATPIALPAPGLYWVWTQAEVAAPTVSNFNENLPPVPQSAQPQVVSCSWTLPSTAGSVPTADPASIVNISYRGPVMKLRLSAVA